MLWHPTFLSTFRGEEWEAKSRTNQETILWKGDIWAKRRKRRRRRRKAYLWNRLQGCAGPWRRFESQTKWRFCRVNPAQLYLDLWVHHADFCDAVSCSLEPTRPVGVLGCVAGWKGPGKQCSLAFLHDRSDANRGTVKGILPLELRGTQRETMIEGNHMFSVGIRRHEVCKIQFFVCSFFV